MLQKLLKQGINIKIRIATFNTDLLLNAVSRVGGLINRTSLF